jgi:hypothetical protein
MTHRKVQILTTGDNMTIEEISKTFKEIDSFGFTFKKEIKQLQCTYECTEENKKGFHISEILSNPYQH